ncbi:MAG: hypothetical protein QM709_06805 [Spongiibacteraceae bacterium]
MNEREALTVTSRERLRQEIAQQTDMFLRSGGHIVHLHAPAVATRPVGSVWWGARSASGLILQS